MEDSYSFGCSDSGEFEIGDGRGGKVTFAGADLDRLLFDVLTMDYDIPDVLARKVLGMAEFADADSQPWAEQWATPAAYAGVIAGAEELAEQRAVVSELRDIT